MRSPFGTLVYLIVGYLCGLIWEPGLFSANLRLTQWENIWVYAWIFGWPLMLLFIVIIPHLLILLNSSNIK